jgi:hypothetical protein
MKKLILAGCYLRLLLLGVDGLDPGLAELILTERLGRYIGYVIGYCFGVIIVVVIIRESGRHLV